MKYCISVEKIIKKTEKILVNANSVDEALNKADGACESGIVDFGNPTDVEEYYNCEIDSDTAMEDNTFDEEQFSDYGIQVIN